MPVGRQGEHRATVLYRSVENAYLVRYRLQPWHMHIFPHTPTPFDVNVSLSLAIIYRKRGQLDPITTSKLLTPLTYSYWITNLTYLRNKQIIGILQNDYRTWWALSTSSTKHPSPYLLWIKRSSESDCVRCLIDWLSYASTSRSSPVESIWLLNLFRLRSWWWDPPDSPRSRTRSALLDAFWILSSDRLSTVVVMAQTQLDLR